MGYRYIGSKADLIDEILRGIADTAAPGSHVADLMSGTGRVAAALRQHGYRVTAADVMTYSFHHARVALLLSEPPTFDNATEFIESIGIRGQGHLFHQSDYDRMIHALNSVEPIRGYFWREFSKEGKPQNGVDPRNYFSPNNAQKIDAIRAAIRGMAESKYITDLEHSLLIHDLIMAANDVANIAGTYGHYLSRLRGRAKDPILLSPSAIHPNGRVDGHSVILGYAEEISAEIECDICYLDPPYMKRQYAANYHILETLAREDEPPANGQSGLRPWRDQYSDFCTKTNVRSAFGRIFEQIRCPQFLISYSEDGLLSRQELEELFAEFGKVRLTELRRNRFRSNNSRLPRQLTEYLFHLKTIT